MESTIQRFSEFQASLILDVNNDQMPSEKSRGSIKEVRFQTKIDQNYENCIDVLKSVNEDLDRIQNKLPKTKEIVINDFGVRGGSIDTAVEF